jgi:hypothetical protein
LLGGDLAGARSGFRTAIRLLEQQGRGGEAAELARRVGDLVRLEAAG